MSIKRLVPLNTVSLPSNPPTAIAGDIYYNSGLSKLLYFNGTDWIELAGSVNSLVYAKSIYQDVRNESGSTIPLGTPVYISGAIGASGKILISPASNASEATSSKTMGITTSAISNNSNGQVISEGLLEGLDTTGAADGDPVWLGVGGAKIYGLANKPTAPAHLVFLGIVVRGGSANTGSIFVKIQNGFELEELHNVSISSLLNGNILAYDSATSTWKNTNTLQSTSSTIPLVIKGAASQTANLQEWQNSSGTVLTSVDKDGYLQTPRLVITNGGNIIDSAGTTPYFGFGSNQIIIYARNAAYKPLVIQGAASQTANLQEWQTSTGSILGKLDKDGKLTTIDIESGALNATWRVYSTAGSPTVVPITAKGAASQTAKLQEWQNSAGTVVASTSVEGNGYFQANLNAASIGAGNNIGGASLTASPWSAATVVSIIRGYTSQSSDLTQWQNSAGTVLTKITSDGSINTSGASGIYSTYGFSSAGGLSIGNGVTSIYVHSTYGMGIRSASGNVTDPTLVIKLGSVNQTGSLQEWHSSTGTVLANVSSAGRINAPQFGSTQSGKAYVNTGTSADNNSWTFVTNSASNKGIVVVGAASQSANLQEWQNNSGTILNSISASGTLNINTSGTGTINLGDGVLAKGPGNGFTFNSDIIVLDGKGIEASSGKFTNVTGISTVPLIAKAISGQTANIQEWQNNSGQVRAKIDSYGGFSSLATTQIGNDLNGSGTSLIVYTKDAAGIPIVIKGFTSQAADLQQWQNSAGTVLSSLRKDGTFAGPYLDGLSADGSYIQFVAGAYVDIVGRVINQPTFRVKSVASQTADIQQWQNSSNTVLAKIAASGQIYNDVSGTEPIVIKSAGSTRFELNQYSQGWSNTTFTFGSYYNTDGGTLPRLSIFSGTADTKGLIIRGFTSQSANLQEWQNISGTVLAKIDASGNATAASFVKTSGTSSQFLKADGSIDSSTYLTTGTASSTYLPLTGGTVSSDLTVTGNFTVNGTTTNLNSTNLVVEDKNIIVADVTTPTDTTADGAGITIKGTTDKTFNWVQSTGSFTSSEPLIVSSNAANNITVFTAKDANNNKVIVNSDASNRTFITAQSNSSATGQAGAYFTADGFEESWFNINTRSNTAGQKYMRFGNLGNKFLVQRLNDAANSIASTPFTIENTSTTNSLYINSTGTIINGATALGQLTVYSASASTIGMVIRGAASQTANLTEWQDSTGYLISRVDSAGSHWINAVPATSGSVEVSSAYLYLTSNRWTGSASTAEVFGLNNFRFGGAGAAGSFALHLKPASSANAYLSIAGDSSRSVGVNVQYPSASSGYGQFGVQIQDASYKGVVVKAATSQAANLQEWQDSAGTVLGYFDINGTLKTNYIQTGLLRSASSNQANLYTGADSGSIRIDTGLASGKGLIVKGAASQTANIQEWQNSAGTVLGGIASNGAAFFGSTGATNATLTAIPTATTVSGIIVRGVASQTANIQEWQINGGSVVTRIGFDGIFRGTISDVSNLGTFTTTSYSATQIPLISRAFASQTANLQEWQDNSGVMLANVGPTGGAQFAGLNVQGTGSGIVNIGTAASGYVGLIIKGVASQTANLQEWQDSAGTVVARITNIGGITTNSNITQGTAGRTFIGGATDSGAFLNVNVPTASRQGIAVRANASQTGNLQEWQNSSGAVLSAIDASGSFTSVSQPIQVAGSTYGFTQLVSTQYGATAYWKIATLPATSLSTCDQINIEAMLGSWSSTGKTKYEIMLGNRDAFAYKYTKFGDGLTQERIQSYTEADGSVSVYLYSENTYTTLAYNITLSAVTSGGNIGATIYKNPTASTTAPTGTKSFDTGEPATYIPLMNMTNAGLLSTKSAIFNPTSASVIPLIVKGAASQTANLQEWQDASSVQIATMSTGGHLRLNSVYNIASFNNSQVNMLTTGTQITSNVASNIILSVKAATSQTANIQEWQNSSSTVLAKVDANGNFSAISKSFDIPHPTKENMRLRYASLEGNEHGVYVRGITKDKVIELPDYWLKLVDKNSITVHLTPIGKPSRIYVKKIEGNKVYLGGRLKEAAYIIHAERKDIDKLTVEY